MSKYVIEFPQANQTPFWEQNLRVAAYCRVSTKHEVQLGSLENQIQYYTEYIRNKPCWQLVAVYYDTASGARTNKRPGYQKMLRDCSTGKIDLIFVKSLSRFGRDALEIIRQIRKLKEINIGVYIETGGIDTMNVNNIIVDQLAAIHQAESQTLSENI